ncbi:protease inhibitor I42 family protein [bacterium]|nr:protease inhibitor I42 family protein [bacterium]
MNVKKLSLVCLLFGIICFSGYMSSNVVSLSNETNQIQVNIGEIFDISLNSNPSTGYSWKAFYSEDFIKQESVVYAPDKTKKIVVGSGGISRFTFKALKQGETEIIFKYFRPWEAPETAVEIKKYIITINENMEIIDVKVGDVFEVKLESNPSTGYTWAPYYAEERISLDGIEYQPNNSDEKIVGSGGVTVFKFKALKSSKTVMTFKYFRPWLGEESAVKIKKYKVYINENTVFLKSGTWNRE